MKLVKIAKKDMYVKKKLYLPKSTTSKYLAIYIMGNKNVTLKAIFPIIMMPVFLAILCTVLILCHKVFER